MQWNSLDENSYVIIVSCEYENDTILDVRGINEGLGWTMQFTPTRVLHALYQ